MLNVKENEGGCILIKGLEISIEQKQQTPHLLYTPSVQEKFVAQDPPIPSMILSISYDFPILIAVVRLQIFYHHFYHNR